MSKEIVFHYMVEFVLDVEAKDIWPHLIEQLKEEIEILYDSGNLSFLSTAENKEKAWGIIKCSSESELLFLLDSLSIIHFCIYEYTELSLIESAHELPIVCLN